MGNEPSFEEEPAAYRRLSAEGAPTRSSRHSLRIASHRGDGIFAEDSVGTEGSRESFSNLDPFQDRLDREANSRPAGQNDAEQSGLEFGYRYTFTYDQDQGRFPNARNLLNRRKVNCDYRRRTYWARDGTVRFERVKDIHDPKAELEAVMENDNSRLERRQRLFVIHMGWLKAWLDFARFGERTPGPIPNHVFVTSRRTIFKNLQYNKHWRAVNEKVWTLLHDKYGGGPAITFEVTPDVDTSDPSAVLEWLAEFPLRRLAIINAASGSEPR